MIMDRTTPYAFIDMELVEQNIRRMIARLSAQGIAHRPHIKTHKSVEIARLQLALGAQGITTAKLSEAEVMAEGGIDDVLIAYPVVGESKWVRFRALHERIRVRTTVDSAEVAEGLSRVGEQSGKPVEVLIELDAGMHRGGVQPEDIVSFAGRIARFAGIRLVGVLSYTGQIYGSQSREEAIGHAEREASLLVDAKRRLEQAGHSISVLSGGSTPASFYPERLRGITESRAGNYVFGDRNAIKLGVMSPEQCALRVRATVVSVPLPGYATIDAGSKTLTSDLSAMDALFGSVVGMPEVRIVKLNEEHGYVRYDPDRVTLRIGDTLEIIPNHSCVIPNLNDALWAERGGRSAGRVTVDARGRNN